MAGRRILCLSVTLTIVLLYFLILNPYCYDRTCMNQINVLERFHVGQTASRSCVSALNTEVKSKSKGKDGKICDTRVASSIITMFKYVLTASLVSSCQHHCTPIALCGDIQPNPGPFQPLILN